MSKLLNERDSILKVLEEWIRLVFDNEDLFLEFFSITNDNNKNFIIENIYWTFNSFYFVYVDLESGAHIADERKISEWFVFISLVRCKRMLYNFATCKKCGAVINLKNEGCQVNNLWFCDECCDKYSIG